MKPQCKDVVYLTAICILITQSAMKWTYDTSSINKSLIKDAVGILTYDMLFNMHVSRRVLLEGDYTWVNMNETDVVCLYGRPKEGDSDRNICLLAKQWLSLSSSFTIVTDTDISCPNVTVIHQKSLGVPDNLKNPFSVSWFVRFLPFDRFVLINDDDLLTSSTKQIIDNPLYFKDKLILHNEGDLAQYRVLKKLYSYGGEYIHVPTSPVLHGPMMVYKKDILLAHKLLKLDRLSECRDGDIWSLTAAVGAIRAIRGEARYSPNNYHYYTQLRTDTTLPSGYLFYCLNDGPELIQPEVLQNKMNEVFNINEFRIFF